jgi:hypothetical protein
MRYPQNSTPSAGRYRGQGELADRTEQAAHVGEDADAGQLGHHRPVVPEDGNSRSDTPTIMSGCQSLLVSSVCHVLIISGRGSASVEVVPHRSSIFAIAACSEDLDQGSDQCQVLVLGVVGGGQRSVGHACAVGSNGGCVSVGYVPDPDPVYGDWAVSS